MHSYVMRWIVNALAFYGAAVLFPAIQLASPGETLLAGVVLGFVNSMVRPLLLLLTLPVNILSLGLFTLVVNTWMVMLTDRLLTGIYIPGFFLAFLTALLVSIFNVLFHRAERRRD